MFDLLRKNIEQHICITDEEFEKLSKNFHLKKIKKKETLLREADVCMFEGFVNKGCFKIFYLDEKASEHILYFAFENWWVTDIDSFTNQIPSKLNIEAIEDSEVLLISKHDKEKLYENLPKVERLFRIMTQKTHVALQSRMISSLSKTADVRYLEFIKKYPKLEQRLSQQQIASYLGITHEFLCKIRKKIFSKA